MVDLQKGVDGYAAGSVLEDALKGLLDQRAQILLVLKKNLKVKHKRYLCRNIIETEYQLVQTYECLRFPIKNLFPNSVPILHTLTLLDRAGI